MSLAECTASGVLIIDGFDLSSGPAFLTPELWNLYATWDVRGDDRLLGGRVGVIPYRRRITVTVHAINLLISGHALRGGGVGPTRAATIGANIAALRDALVVPPATTQGTRSASLTTATGSNLSGPVHVQRFEPGEVVAGWMQSTLTISIPGGRLT